MGRDRTRLERLENLQSSFSVLTPTLNYVIVADGATFNSVALSGDASITSAGIVSVSKILGVPIFPTLAAGNLLISNGVQWNSVAVMGDIIIDQTGLVTVTQINTAPLGTTLAGDGAILVERTGVINARIMSGDATLDSTGNLTIQPNVVTNAKTAQMAANTFKANLTSGVANAADKTLDTVRAALDPTDYAGSTAGTGTYTATLAPVPTGYTTGQHYNLIFTSTNTTATPTANLNSLGAKTLKKDGATLGIGQIRAGSVHTFTYDGTDMQITSPLPGPVLLACITGVNLKSVATTALYTVPTGKTCLVTQALVNCAAATAITVAATAGIGVAAGSGDIYAQVAMTNLTATTKVWGWSTQGLIVNVAAAAVINFGVSVAATGTSQTADVYLYGFLI